MLNYTGIILLFEVNLQIYQFRSFKYFHLSGFSALSRRKYDGFHLIQATWLDRDLKRLCLWYNQRFLKEYENQPNQRQISKSRSLFVLTQFLIRDYI